MAYCSNCGKDIGGGGEACDACGAKRPSSTGPLLGGVILGVVVTGLGVSIFGGGDDAKPYRDAAAPARIEPAATTQVVTPSPQPTQRLVTPPAPSPAPTPAPAPKPVVTSAWNYSVEEDPMSSAKSFYATVVSTNQVEFDFPYGGPQNALLTLRTHARHGKDVLFRIQKGQILCPSYEGCQVLVRFDDEPATKYSANGAADNSTETVFLENYGRFAEKVLKAKRVRISAEIYQQGSPVFEFDVSGFDVKKYRPE